MHLPLLFASVEVIVTRATPHRISLGLLALHLQ